MSEAGMGYYPIIPDSDHPADVAHEEAVDALRRMEDRDGRLTVHRDIVQRSDEWYAARLGMVTASVVSSLLTTTLRVADNDTSRRVIRTLAAERIAGWAEPGPTSWDMLRGIEEEVLARDAYSEHHAPVEDCGLMVRSFGGWRLGYSPDGLVGDDGLIEIKSRAHHIHIGTILSDQPVPAGVMAQLQTALLVSGRAWIDYVSYSSGMPLWVQRVIADADYQKAIREAVTEAETRIRQTITDYRTRVDGLPVMPRTPDRYSDDMEVA